MKVGIIGFPESGRRTIFKALVGFESPDRGVVKVKDPRLEELEKLLSPKRVVPVEVEYIRFDESPRDFTRYEGIKGKFLLELSQVDIIIHVVRAFDDPSVPHVYGDVNPERDINSMEGELMLSDLLIIERRMERIESQLRGAKGHERDNLIKEKDFLSRLKKELEDEKPLRKLPLTGEEKKAIAGYGFLSLKPSLIVLNLGEEKLGKEYSIRSDLRVVPIYGKLEAELMELEEKDREEMRRAMGLPPDGSRVMRECLSLLDMITFFTTVSDEIRAWAIERGTRVQKASGKIHSDMERGFIRAEVISFDDLIKSGGFSEARRKGLIRVEGKDYEVRDGDIIKVLFNV